MSNEASAAPTPPRPPEAKQHRRRIYVSERLRILTEELNALAKQRKALPSRSQQDLKPEERKVLNRRFIAMISQIENLRAEKTALLAERKSWPPRTNAPGSKEQPPRDAGNQHAAAETKGARKPEGAPETAAAQLKPRANPRKPG